MTHLVPLSIALVVLAPAVLHASQHTYEIEGLIAFPGDGTIYVYLVDEEAFEKPLTGIQTIVIDPDERQVTDKIARFRFDGVPAGTYGIRSFQDTNGDGKLNKGVFGPSEPWGMSWKASKPSRWPRFDQIAFDVSADVVNLLIELK